jgi:hypothetical protein
MASSRAISACVSCRAGIVQDSTIVEPAAAALAAARRDRKQLERMQHALDGMERYTLHAAEGRLADQEFHAALLLATANPFKSAGRSMRKPGAPRASPFFTSWQLQFEYPTVPCGAGVVAASIGNV